MAKCNLDEYEVIKRYEECETARIVAQEFGVSTETIYRILKRNGIQRTHRHPKEPKRERVSNCNTKHCPALVVMLRTVLDMRSSDIARLMGCRQTAVTSIISRKGIQCEKPVKRTDVDIDAIEREYLAGASTYELGEKYGVNHATISTWMRELGHVRGKGANSLKAAKAGHEQIRKRAIRKVEADLSADGGNLSLVRFVSVKKSVFKCNTCGFVFERWSRHGSFPTSCPECEQKKADARKQLKEEERKKREAERLTEYEKDKECAYCGSVFHSEQKEAKYCSIQCRRNAHKKRRDARLKQSGRYVGKDTCHRKRAKKFGVPYDSSITWRSLSKQLGHCN